jgi:PKD repeat protein
MVSEIATLVCYPNTVFGTLNWTGVPLFHLLTLAKVRPEATKVVFRATDGYSSSLTIEEALEPNIILALKANGTLLSEVSWIGSIAGSFRIIVPCKYGYKWVAKIAEIEVVDYDYKGTYESRGYSDDASIANCTSPLINPPLQTFDLIAGVRRSKMEAFTNISINDFNFDYLQKEISLNVTVPSGVTGFADFILQQNLLKGPYSIFVDENLTETTEANVTDISLLYARFAEGSHTVRIVGTEFLGRVPEINVEFNKTVYVGEQVTFDASKSLDDGQIVSYEWNFGNGSTATGTIAHASYSKEGTYDVGLKLTDNDGFSTSITLVVTVKEHEQYVPLALSASLAIILCLLATILVAMFIRRKPRDVDNTRIDR